MFNLYAVPEIRRDIAETQCDRERNKNSRRYSERMRGRESITLDFIFHFVKHNLLVRGCYKIHKSRDKFYGKEKGNVNFGFIE